MNNATNYKETETSANCTDGTRQVRSAHSLRDANCLPNEHAPRLGMILST